MPERYKKVRGVARPETGTSATTTRYDHEGPCGNLNGQMPANARGTGTSLAGYQRTDSNSPISA